MSRTDLNASTLARSLRMMAGDGSMEWVMEPIQASALLDVADMLDENVKLRDERERLFRANVEKNGEILRLLDENAKLRERVAELDELLPENGRWFSFDTVDAYVVENRKLRELVRDMWGWLTVRTVGGAALHDISGRMRELGIEVDA